MDTISQMTPQYLAQVLQTLHDQVTDFVSRSGERASDDSIFLIDFRTYKKRDAIMTMLSQANMILSAASDHLAAMALLLREGKHSMAVWTCARGAIEACALVAWLLDPKAGTRLRVQRSVSMRLEDLGQQLRFANSEGDTEAARRIGERMVSVRSDAVALGVSTVRQKSKTKNKGGELKMPNITELIQNEFGSGTIYRILSQSNHMTLTIMRQLNYDPVAERLIVTDGDLSAEVQLPTRGLQPYPVIAICLEAAKAYAKANWNRGELLGLDRNELAMILDHSYDDLRISQALRFWATGLMR